MPTAPRQWARAELLRRLLEAHERSTSFGKPGPWPRDVIVRVDRPEFPEAFAPFRRLGQRMLYRWYWLRDEKL